MEDFITEDVKTLIKHINAIAFKRKLNYVVGVHCDLINHRTRGEMELKHNYMLHSEVGDDKLIISSSISVPYDQYIDDKENLLHWANHYFYQSILTHTSFEPELTEENSKYKWN